MNEKELTHIDLFSGIGGFSLAGEWAGFRTIVFCEKDEFCQKVLQKRFGAIIADTESMGRRNGVAENKGKKPRKINPFSNQAPLLIPEIRDFDGTKWRSATLLTGGFPCQPFSVAGPRTGKEDDRYLWPEMLRIIKEARPRWVLAENVPGIFRMALDTVLADLEGEGYSTGTFIIPACGLNAPHRRNRVWIVAHAIRTGTGNQDGKAGDQKGRIGQDRRKSIRQEDGAIGTTNNNASDSDRFNGNNTGYGSSKIPQQKEAEIQRSDNSYAPNSQCLGWQKRARNKIEYEKQISEGQDIGNGYAERLAWEKDWYEVATRFCRVDDGLPAWIHSYRVARLKALGNAIVPQIAYEILKNIAWIERNE